MARMRFDMKTGKKTYDLNLEAFGDKKKRIAKKMKVESKEEASDRIGSASTRHYLSKHGKHASGSNVASLENYKTGKQHTDFSNKIK